MSNSEEHDARIPSAIEFALANYPIGDRYLVEGMPKRLNSGGECPDFLGWMWPRGLSLMFDVIVRAANAREHFEKPHVKNPALGMGNYRVAVTAHDVGRIPLPKGWGHWHQQDDGSYAEVVEPQPFYEINIVGERELLMQLTGSGNTQQRRDARQGNRTTGKLTDAQLTELRNAVHELGPVALSRAARWISSSDQKDKDVRKAIRESTRQLADYGVAIRDDIAPAQLVAAEAQEE